MKLDSNQFCQRSISYLRHLSKKLLKSNKRNENGTLPGGGFAPLPYCYETLPDVGDEVSHLYDIFNCLN